MIDHAETLLERLPLVSYVLAAEAPSRALYVSPQIETMFGIDREAFDGGDDVWTRRIAEADRDRFLDALATLRQGEAEMSVDYRIDAADGSQVWVRDVARVDDGLIHGYLVDVTREKELEEELAVERATLDAFFTRSRIGLGITDADGRYVRINEALAQINGGSPGDFIGRTLAEAAPDLATHVDALRARAVDGGEHEVDISWSRGDLHALLSYFPFEVHGEAYLGRAVVDMTEQRRAQAAERQYRDLLGRLPLVVYVNDISPKRAARFVSPQIEELTGYTAEEFVADPELGDKMIHPDDLAEITELERAGDVFEHEYRIVRTNGEVRWVLDRMETIRGDDGQPLYEQGFLIDITDRRDTATLLRAVWSETLDAMVIAGGDGRYVDVNPAACQLFGRPREEIVGATVDELVGRGVWESYLQGGTEREYQVVRPSGEQRIVEPATKPNVLPGLHLAVLRDVTERRELEEEIWRAQKLESVGRLAGGVAHDFNNLLTAIGGYAQLLRSRMPAGSIEHSYASEIDSVAERAAALTAQLLALGRRQTLRVRPLDLNRQLEEHAAGLAEIAGPRVQLTFDLAPALHAVRADGALLDQAIANIVANAADAMHDGGEIVVATRNEDVRSRDDLPPGSYVVLSISDTGPGIDATSLEHVFEPFFTTKEVGIGSGGLGLASAYGTVRQSGGTILVETTIGVGTTFSIYLPEAEGDAARPAGAGRGEMVLVVERDPAVRDVAYELLTDAAYRVLTARTTADAVRLAERYEGPIHLLLTDLDPVRERALVDLLRVQRPDLQALSLGKPYTPERLRSAVRDALGSPKRVTGGHRNA